MECIQTGLRTPRGGRLRRAADVIDGERFCVSYADGVANIDLRALLATHDRHRPQATMTVVHPELQFGVAELNGDGVVRLPDVRGAGTPAGEIDRQWGDYSKLHQLTGWEPSVTLEEGLRRTLEWHRRHG